MATTRLGRTLSVAGLAFCVIATSEHHSKAADPATAFIDTTSTTNWTLESDRDLVFDTVMPVVESDGVVATSVESTSWRWLGKGKMSRRKKDDLETPWMTGLEAEPDLGAAAVASLSPDSWIAVNVATGYEYEVDLPKDLLKMLRRQSHAAGLNRPDEGSVDNVSSAVDEEATLSPSEDTENDGTSEALDAAPTGWSDGVDTRTRRTNNTAFPYRAMGQLNGGTKSGCSGTLIGPRHVITAAHCLWSWKKRSWSTVTFRPGREGTCNNVWCEPYGESQAIWYFTPSAFRQNVSSFWDINQYDYGIMVLGDRLGELTGWMGYVAANTGTTRDLCDKVPFGPGFLGGDCYNRGYPACGFSENKTLDGNNCLQGWAYQDVNSCEIGSFKEKDADGWNQTVSVNCDTGRGHSGSALWTDRWNGSGKVVLGVDSASACRTCGRNDDFPNTFRRITPEVLSWISYFKTVKFP